MAASVRKRTGLQQEVDPSVNEREASTQTATIEEAIAMRAYEIYLDRGGNDVDDWLQAENELRA